MITNKNSITCHPRQLKHKLEKFISRHNLHDLSKRNRIISWLILSNCEGCKNTRFDAEWVGDHCFNTTASEIQRLDCIPVQREPTKVPTRFGMTDCKQYWLDNDGLCKAKKHLGIK